MVFPAGPLAIVLLAVSLLGLVFVLGGCAGLVLAHRKRAGVAWGRGKRVLVGIGGLLTSLAVLLLPQGVAWFVYHRAVGGIDRALATGASSEAARIVAQSIDSAWNVSYAAGLADLVLLVPCAVLAGLAVTVPFFLEDSGKVG